MRKKISPSSRYALAVASVAAATLVRMLLTNVLGPHFPFFSFYVAVIVTTWFAGFTPGMMAIALGYLSADVFFYDSGAVEADLLSVVVYLIVTLTIALFGKSMHESSYRMEMSLLESKQQQRELEEEIARRKEAEEALRVSEEQFRASFELAAVGEAQIDPVSGCFKRVNAKLCSITGYSEEELLQMTLRQITYPEDSEWDTKTFRKMVDGKSADQAFEKRYICKGGRVMWVNVAAALIRDKEGRPWRTTSVIQDVTARRRAEEALELAQQKLSQHAGDLEEQVAERTAKLTETIESLEAFCYSIAHDLRTPIRAMQGYAAVLLEDYPLSESGKDYAARIAQASVRMDQLVQDLLAYGRLTHEQIHRELLNLETVVDDVISKLADEIGTKQAQIYILRPLPDVFGHPAILEQVLVNLLRNAMKFVSPGTPPRIYIRAEDMGKTVRLCIDDNGIGIEPQYQHKVFKVFERLHCTEEYPGTGIGLAIVKKAVERLGGRVGIESQPGRGSCFWLELSKRGPLHLLAEVGSTTASSERSRSMISLGR
jgi:PAS domain S-box-containing protein